MNDYEQQLNEEEEKIIAQQQEIEQLKEDKLFYSNQWEKVSKENKSLLGVIDGMRIIIKNLENKELNK